MLTENGNVLDYLTDWIQNFVATREITLAYPGSPRRRHEVNKGILHGGSPLSALLFVIYVKKLHSVVTSNEFFMTSYVDDFQLTVASSSWERNARKLEKKASVMMALAQFLGLSFSIAKTELIHRRTRREKGPRSDSSVTIQAHMVQQAGMVVRWLGYWLADSGETTSHFTKRLLLAQGAFWRFPCLSLPGKGLSPYGAR